VPFSTAIDRSVRSNGLLSDSPNAHAILRTHSDLHTQNGLNVDITLNEHGSLLVRVLQKESISDFDSSCTTTRGWISSFENGARGSDRFSQSSDFSSEVFLPQLLEKVGS
jgi:hypothetical protein